jgi:hypothetical protein
LNDDDYTARQTAPLYFRSNVASGAFETPASWLVSTDINFVAPTGVVPNAAPNYGNSDDIKILNGHNITVSALAGVDQLTVNSGGTLTIGTGATFVVYNGTGTDLQVDGSFVNQSSVAASVVGTIVFSSAATYTHATSA